MTSLLEQLRDSGQAPWLDFVDRSFQAEGGLKKLVEEDGVTGVTSNPAIFEKAMGQGDAYDAEFKSFVEGNAGATITDTYEALAVSDIRDAADTLKPVYDKTDGLDGYVSFEVSPYLADTTEATIEEARRLWKMVDRPNLMVKVPGTKAGAPAIRQLIEEEAASDVLSDDSIVELLRKTGVDIARRTVAKYREGMNIPSSVQRRREKRAQSRSAAE